MSFFRTAAGYRSFYQDISGNLQFTASTGTTTLATVKNSNYTLYIQRIVVFFTTSAAQSVTFDDTSNTYSIAVIPASPGVDTRWDFDFGDAGMPLASGKSFEINMTAGNAGVLTYYGYQKLNNATAVAST